MALLWLNMGPILVALEQDPTISAPPPPTRALHSRTSSPVKRRFFLEKG